MHKSRIYVLSSVFHRSTSRMSEYVFYVFGIIEIQRNRFQHVVMHVSIVKERRKGVRGKSKPSGRRNKPGINLNFLLRQTIHQCQCSGQAYGDPHFSCNPLHVPKARRVFCLISIPCTLTTVSAGRQCISQVLF